MRREETGSYCYYPTTDIATHISNLLNSTILLLAHSLQAGKDTSINGSYGLIILNIEKKQLLFQPETDID